MDHKELQNTLNQLIAVDVRPVIDRDQYQRFHGHKRTHIIHAEVIPLAGATQDITQADPVANSGTTTQGVLQQFPLTPQMIHQGQLADCYLLSSVNAIITYQPYFFDDVVYAVDSGHAVCQYIYSGNLVRIHTSLLVSTSYDQEGSADIRIELLEKTYGLLRTGVSDYTKANFGTPTEAFSAFGLDAVASGTKSISTYIAPALDAGKPVVLLTLANTTGNDSTGQPWVPSHVYAVKGVDASGNLIIQNPWYGGVNITLDQATLNQSFFWGVGVGTFVNPKRLSAPAPAVSSSSSTGVTMATISIPSTGSTTIAANSATSVVGCQLETVNNKVDVGYMTVGGYAEYSLNVAAGGTYTVAIEFSGPGAGSAVVTVNGANPQTVPTPATGGWQSWQNASVAVNLPAGPVALRITCGAGQYNIGNVSIAAGGVVTTPTKTVKNTITLYTDGTYTLA